MTEHDIGETVDLEISDVVYPGRGIARLDNLVIFVAGGITGELVRAQITSRRRNFAEARLIEAVRPATSRMEPECPLALRPLSCTPAGHTACPGCCYQHIRYKEETRLKDAQLTNMIERLGGGPPEGTHMEPVAAPDAYHYRNKIVLHVSAREGKPSIGYVSEDNRTVVPVSRCPLARPEINERLKELLADSTFVERLENRARLTIRFTEADGVCHWVGSKPEKTRWFTESTALGNVRVPCAGFFQVNSAIANRLLEEVKSHIGRIRPAAVIDLYCGSGIFSIAAAGSGVPAVLGIDLDRRSIKAARFNAHVRGLKQTRFVASPAAGTIREALKPVPAGETLLILDPPRRGLDKEVSEVIAGSGPAHLVYVSCAPDTLARDLRMLRGAGYGIESRRVFDMFPRTAHFESLVTLSRR